MTPWIKTNYTCTYESKKRLSLLSQVSKTMKHARKGTCIITNPFYSMSYTISKPAYDVYR